jgi:hypothetical protein
LGGSVYTVKEKTEAIAVASTEIGLEANADETKYKVMSRSHDVGQSHSIQNDNSSFENVEEFKCLGTTLTNQNSLQEEIKSRWKSENA